MVTASVLPQYWTSPKEDAKPLASLMRQLLRSDPKTTYARLAGDLSPRWISGQSEALSAVDEFLTRIPEKIDSENFRDARDGVRSRLCFSLQSLLTVAEAIISESDWPRLTRGPELSNAEVFFCLTLDLSYNEGIILLSPHLSVWDGKPEGDEFCPPAFRGDGYADRPKLPLVEALAQLVAAEALFAFTRQSAGIGMAVISVDQLSFFSPRFLMLEPTAGPVPADSADFIGALAKLGVEPAARGFLQTPDLRSREVSGAVLEGAFFTCLFVATVGDSTTGNAPALEKFNLTVNRTSRAAYVSLNAIPYLYSLAFDPSVDGGVLIIGENGTYLIDPSSLATVGHLVGASEGSVGLLWDGAVAIGGYPSTTVYALQATTGSSGITFSATQIASFNFTVNGPISVDLNTDAVLVPDVVDGAIQVGIVGPAVEGARAFPSVITLGNVTAFSVAVISSTQTLRFSYSGLPGSCDSAADSSYPCIPTQVGSFNFTATVTDGSGLSVQAMGNLVVLANHSTGPSTFAVTFTESGLAAGTAWNVVINSSVVVSPGVFLNTSTNLSSKTASVGIDESPGSDSYVAWAPGYTASPASGKFNVVLAAVNLTVTFTKNAVSPQTGNISGTATPSNATVSVDGHAISSTGGTFRVIEAAGTYDLNATAPGFQEMEKVVTVVPGQTSSESLVLLRNTSTNQTNPSNGTQGTSQSPLGALGAYWPIVLVLAIIVVGGIARWLYVQRGRGKGSQTSPGSSAGPGSSDGTPAEWSDPPR